MDLCPRCGKPNLCAMAAGKDPRTCWCMAVTFPARDPGTYRGMSCLCRACVEELRREEGTAPAPGAPHA